MKRSGTPPPSGVCIRQKRKRRRTFQRSRRLSCSAACRFRRAERGHDSRVRRNASHVPRTRSNGAVAAPGKYPPRFSAKNRWPAPLASSSSVQNQVNPRAPRQFRRTGRPQQKRPKATSRALAVKNPAAGSSLKRLLMKRAGARTSYDRVRYSSIECAACVRMRIKNARRILRSTEFPACYCHYRQTGNELQRLGYSTASRVVLGRNRS